MPIYNPIQIDLDDVEDLSSQCNGSNTTFDFGKKVRGIYWVNLNGTILIDGVDFTFDSNSEGITLVTFTPDNGEQLYAKVLI